MMKNITTVVRLLSRTVVRLLSRTGIQGKQGGAEHLNNAQGYVLSVYACGGKKIDTVTV